MEYKCFSVRAFEAAPGKWRAKVQRADGRHLKIGSRKKLKQFVTGLDAETAAAAMLMAIAAIDAGTFGHNKSA